MVPDKLLLWDIDGTLIRAGRSGEIAIERAWKEVTGVLVDLSKIDYSGRTDRMIGHQLFAYSKLPFEEKVLHQFVETYLSVLGEELSKEKHGHRLPGILDVLEIAAKRQDISQALLTGNME